MQTLDDLADDLVSLENHMVSNMGQFDRSFCQLFEVSSLDKIMFVEESEKIVYTTAVFKDPNQRSKFVHNALRLRDYSEARPFDDLSDGIRLDPNVDAEAIVYRSRQGVWRGLMLYRCHPGLIFAWAADLPIDRWQTIADRCARSNMAASLVEIEEKNETIETLNEKVEHVRGIVSILVGALAREGMMDWNDSKQILTELGEGHMDEWGEEA